MIQSFPEDLDGLLLCGGYPELNGKALEENQEMCSSIQEGRGRWNALSGGMRRFYVSSSGNGRYGGKFPQSLRRDPGKMLSVHRRLTRFGYITLTEKKDLAGPW